MVARLDDRRGVELFEHCGPGKSRAQRQRLAAIDRRLAPAAFEPDAALARERAVERLRLLARGEDREIDRAAAADDGGVEIDQHGADLGQRHLEALPICPLERLL